MSSSLITKLKTLIEEGGNSKKIEEYENTIAESFEKYVKKDSFYELSTNEILKIIEKIKNEDYKTLHRLIPRMCAYKGKKSTLLLNVIKVDEAPFEECIKLLSKFEHSQLCQRTSELFKEEVALTERDYQHEIEDLKKQIEELQSQGKAKKPADFEEDIFKAAKEGKLTSIKYLFEECHADVEAKNEDEMTPLNIASLNGHLDVAKYLFETCHANVESKNKEGRSPLSNAAIGGNFEIVKYLVENCHANIFTQDKRGYTAMSHAQYFTQAGPGAHLDILHYLGNAAIKIMYPGGLPE